MLRRAAPLMALLVPTLHADPLHAIANDAYWHHESNLIFPATLVGFERVGAPQELDGSSTVVAHYARGADDGRSVVVIEVTPVAEVVAADRSAAESGASVFVRVTDHAGWRIVVRARVADEAIREAVDALLRALPVERLGAIDERRPDAGCGR